MTWLGAFSALLTIVVTAAKVSQAFMPPLINDVSTDLDNPPSFVVAKIGDLPEEFKEHIRKLYPDLKSLVISDKSKAEVFQTAMKLAEAQPRWRITHAHLQDGILEGIATTFLFRFKDDFVVRMVEKEGTGVVVDMRSRSRVGKGDLGTNAGRIKHFFALLKSAFEVEKPAPKAT